MAYQLLLDGSPVSDAAFALLCRAGALMLARDADRIPEVDLLRPGAPLAVESKRVDRLLTELQSLDLAQRSEDGTLTVPMIGAEMESIRKGRRAGRERKKRERSRATYQGVTRDQPEASRVTKKNVVRDTGAESRGVGSEVFAVAVVDSPKTSEAQTPPPIVPPQTGVSRVTLSPHQAAVGQLGDAFSRHGAPVPEASFLALLLRMVVGDARAATVLIDKLAGVDPAALANRGRVRGWFKAGAPSARPGFDDSRSEDFVGL